MMAPHRRNSHDDATLNPLDENLGPKYDRINGPWPCGAPKGCLYHNGSNAEHIMILQEDLRCGETVRVICSNDNCPISPFLHAACFQAFEESVMSYLKSQGRARGWSEKQRQQNLWTKRGYDLVYKACDCPCGHGHLRKDLDWNPPGGIAVMGDPPALPDVDVNQVKRKRKKSKSQNAKPALTIGLPNFAIGASSSQGNIRRSDAQSVPRNRTNSLSSNTSGSSSTSSPCELSSASPSSNDGIQPPRRALLQDRSRHDSGGSIFQRRMDYSSFNVLPRNKINSYHIKMEDECSIGNDETRIFILSSYASNKMNRVPCVLCKSVLNIYDRYPLIDGTFFLSPRQHTKSCIQVKSEGKTSYLTAVCMSCLEGWTGGGILCRYCLKPWNGAHLILGTMYSYDIFAAMPCCPDRLKCNNCGQLVVHPEQRFNFFSDYSQMVSCPHCGAQEAHFAKTLAVYVRADEAAASRQMSLVHNYQLQHQAAALRSGVQRVNSA